MSFKLIDKTKQSKGQQKDFSSSSLRRFNTLWGLLPLLLPLVVLVY